MERWYTLFTQPHREHLVQSAMQNQRFETYLPVTRPARTRSGRRSKLPFFPRYLFVRADLNVVGESSLRWTPGVTSLVSFGGEPASVPDEAIWLIQERLDAVRRHRFGGLERGDRVRIRNGPLRDLMAVFEKGLSPSGRVRVLLEFLGQHTVCEVELDCLEPVRVRP